MQIYNNFQNASLLILRLITVSIFFVAAYYKIPYWSFEPEGISAFLLFTTRLLSIAEPLGAIAVLFGFLTRLAAIGLIIILIGAIFVTQFVFGMGFVTPTGAGWNMPLAVLGGCLVLAAFGPGSWSVDSRIRKIKSK
jgi:putative oxidoreductase